MSVRSFIVSLVIAGSSNLVGFSNRSLAAFDQLQLPGNLGFELGDRISLR